jgi:hypothetical protein
MSAELLPTDGVCSNTLQSELSSTRAQCGEKLDAVQSALSAASRRHRKCYTNRMPLQLKVEPKSQNEAL